VWNILSLTSSGQREVWRYQ